MKFITQAAVAALIVGTAMARCPNGCSGNGECGTNSQCECHRNFMGADCSERICYFSYAFVDTPLGDINADGMIDMRINKNEKTRNYATEAYDFMYGVARPITTQDVTGAYNEDYQSGRWDEAHFYRECSNKGICNRATGQCECFPGYEGEGCQRTACPGTESGSPCSGHGLCLSAYVDYSDSEYNLWDTDKTMKCRCDAGYSGPDCSLRSCPVGPDPVEHADKVTTSLQKISWGAFQLTTDSTANPSRTTHSGAFNGPLYFTITAQDDFGDSWTTKSLSIDYRSTYDTANGYLYSQPVLSADFITAGGNIDFYSSINVADDVNASVQALPNGAVADAYVWMEYHNLAKDAETKAMWAGGDGFAPAWSIGADATAVDLTNDDYLRYPFDASTSSPYDGEQSAGHEGLTTYFDSSRTRFPDFTNSEHSNCGQIMNSQDGVAAVDVGAEGLCIFISSSNEVTSNYVVTYNINSEVKVTSGGVDTTYNAATMSGYSTSITRTDATTGDASSGFTVGYTIDSAGTMIDGTDIPVVTVESVGANRYWDVNSDGYPKLSYVGFNTEECSRRGLCDYETGECQCFSGYTGVACSSQNSLSFSS